jgi:hypothetical protein
MLGLLVLLALPLSGCFPEDAIRRSGLKKIRLGDPLPPMGSEYWWAYPAKDTMFLEKDYLWRGVILRFPEGRVYLEEDFFQMATLNRIRIETPDLLFKRKIRVGNSLRELKAMGGKWEILYLPEYHKVDIYVKGVHFLVSGDALPEAKRPGAADFFDAQLTPVDLELDFPIQAIVVM